MANQKISQLAPAGAITGSELLELVQGGVNVKGTVDVFLQRAITKYHAVNPGPGTYTDNVLPGAYDYILDYNITAGNITLDGFVAVRDAQRITIRAAGSGANVLNIGGTGAGSAGNQVSASGAIATSLLAGDSKTFQYSNDLAMWVQQ
jgi:hypothetical protein